MRKWLLLGVLVVAGCVNAEPVGVDAFCPMSPPDTVTVGNPWYGEVVACYERPTIVTQVRR